MKVIIQPSIVAGKILAPASKSIMQRACAAALIRKGKTIIHNYGVSNDDKSAINIIRNFGALVSTHNNTLIVDSTVLNLKSNKINCGESGLCARMFTPIAATFKNEFIIEGTGSLLNRPFDFFEKILPHLFVSTKLNNGKLPITVKGELLPVDIEVDGGLSSQFITGLLFAYSYQLNNFYFNLSSINNYIKDSVCIKVNHLVSKPYIDLTLKVMNDFGLFVPENDSYKTFCFKKQNCTQHYHLKPLEYDVEGDWSNAAFMMVAAAIAGNITVSGLFTNTFQADKKILDVLIACGAKISINNADVLVQKNELNSFYFDATDCPDLFPPLVALAANCNGISTIIGVNRLIHKESNRAVTLQSEFKKMGVELILEDNIMKIVGGKQIQEANVLSHSDHRIAMACAIAALNSNSNTCINGIEAVNKSYPNFFTDLQKIGVNLKYNG